MSRDQLNHRKETRKEKQQMSDDGRNEAAAVSSDLN